MTCYVSLGSYPRQISWRAERLKAAAFVTLPAPDIPRYIKPASANETSSEASDAGRSRAVRSDALDAFLTEEQRQTLWKHMEHLSSELFDRDRARHQQRRQTDEEYRQHLLSIRAELTERIIAEAQSKLVHADNHESIESIGFIDIVATSTCGQKYLFNS